MHLAYKPSPGERLQSVALPSPGMQVNTIWQNNPTNYDDLPTALLTLYEIGSLEIWEVHMLEVSSGAAQSLLSCGASQTKEASTCRRSTHLTIRASRRHRTTTRTWACSTSSSWSSASSSS